MPFSMVCLLIDDIFCGKYRDVVFKSCILRKRYGIVKKQQNLMDIHLQYIYGFILILFNPGLIRYSLLEVFYHSLGQDLTFSLWIFEIFLENFGRIKENIELNLLNFFLVVTRVLFNFVFLLKASSRLPEFNGYKGLVFNEVI